MDERAATPRIRSAAALAPLLGLVLLLPPLIALFTAPVRVLGIPLIVLYLFGLWAALIAGAARLARHLDTASQAPDDDEPPPSAGPPA